MSSYAMFTPTKIFFGGCIVVSSNYIYDIFCLNIKSSFSKIFIYFLINMCIIATCIYSMAPVGKNKHF